MIPRLARFLRLHSQGASWFSCAAWLFAEALCPSERLFSVDNYRDAQGPLDRWDARARAKQRATWN